MEFYVGTSGYAYKPWKGAFYPQDLPETKMLHYYGEQFRAVEINSTFYRMPKASVLEAWATQVPENFQFAFKAPQRITHFQRLQSSEASVAYLLSVTGALEGRLGPLLFQLPPYFRKDVARLRDFLGLLPLHCRVAFEFRHASWFDAEVFDLLSGHGATLCVADADNDLRVPCVATADWGYLRLRRRAYGDLELEAWREQILDHHWREAYVFFKHEDTARGPLLARRFLELAGARPTPASDQSQRAAA